MTFSSRILTIAALLTTSVACKQLLKNADEIGSGLARNSDSVTDVARRGDGAAELEALLRKSSTWDHAAQARTSMAKLSLDVAPDLLDKAVEALDAEGEAVADSDLDLSGKWASTSDLEEGGTATSSVERKKIGPSTYAFRQVITMSQGEMQIATMAYSGVEVFGPTSTCVQVDHTEIVKVSPMLPKEAAASMRAEFTPAMFADDPCDPVKKLDADTVSTVDDEGVVYTETRVH